MQRMWWFSPILGVYHPAGIFDPPGPSWIERWKEVLLNYEIKIFFCWCTLVLLIRAQRIKIYLVEKHSFEIQNTLFIKAQVHDFIKHNKYPVLYSNTCYSNKCMVSNNRMKFKWESLQSSTEFRICLFILLYRMQ